MSKIAKVIETFHDNVLNLDRAVDEVFETTEERFAVFAGDNTYGRAFVVEAEGEATASAENAELTVAEIKALLDEKGISYDKKAPKATLLELLNGAKAEQE